jgi:hypothetical protein
LRIPSSIDDLILFAADGLLKTLQQPLGLLPRYLAELGQLVQQKAGHHTGDAQRRQTTDQPSVVRSHAVEASRPKGGRESTVPGFPRDRLNLYSSRRDVRGNQF